MHRKAIKITADGLSYAFALILAYWIRFDGRPPAFEFRQMLVWLPIVVVITLLCNAWFGTYRRIWRYVSLFDGIVLAYSAAVMTAILVLCRMFLTMEQQIFRPALGVIATDFMVAVGVTSGLRMVTRIYYEYREGRHVVLPSSQADASVLLVGAGMAGILVANEIRSSGKLRWNIMGFVDDDPAKRNTVIHGIRVLGQTSDLPRLVRENGVDKVIVSIARAASKDIRRIIEICEAIPVRTQIIPGLFELLEGKGEEISKVRDVRIDDLLGRNVVRISESATEMSLCFRNKVIFISGAGGSIGGELCRQLALLSPRILLMVDKDENGVFETVFDLKRRFPYVNSKTLIADLRNPKRLSAIFEDFHPEVIFHAAAHKHVPLMEENVFEAVENNVLGTMNLIECCERYSAARFVMLSTDKAVNCTNVIGATKRIAELYIQHHAATSGVKYSCVRFGNVLGSRGSVVPIFQKQIADGGPVTVTHPEVTRYFMTIPEASQLVIQAASLGERGEIFILEMGKPIRILDLARDLILLSGFKDADIEVKFIGLRPGEKLHEEVVHQSEKAQKTKYDRILVAEPMPIGLDNFDKALESLRDSLKGSDEEGVRRALFVAARAGQSPSAGVIIPSQA
jgi:FlaA1/EpsC-like NDP-sugar epimerase